MPPRVVCAPARLPIWTARSPTSPGRPPHPPDKEISSIFKVILKNIQRICPVRPICARRNGHACPPVTPARKPPDAQYDNPDATHAHGTPLTKNFCFMESGDTSAFLKEWSRSSHAWINSYGQIGKLTLRVHFVSHFTHCQYSHVLQMLGIP
jgi:hypothetical protein